MTGASEQDRWLGEKRNAASHAVERVGDGMVVGLGTGSTAALAIEALGKRVDTGLDIKGVPTSYQAAETARTAGVPVTSLDDVDRVDIAIDGADQVHDGTVIKGAGGAHAQERVVGAFADEFVIIVDSRKISDRLDHPVPVEIIEPARRPVERSIEALDGTAHLRTATGKAGPVITDNGNLLLDCEFGVIDNPYTLADRIARLPGVVDHGLFVDLADEIVVGHRDRVDTTRYED